MAVSQLGGFFATARGARSISKVGPDEIGFCRPQSELRNRDFTSLHVAANHDSRGRRTAPVWSATARPMPLVAPVISAVRRHLRLLAS